MFPPSFRRSLRLAPRIQENGTKKTEEETVRNGRKPAKNPNQVIRHIGAEGLDRRGPVGSCRLFLGPGFRLAARWNRLGQAVKTRKQREKTGGNGRDVV